MNRGHRETDQIVFRITNRETEQPVGSYSRACGDEYDHNSADNARNANVHGMFENREKYRIDRYRVTYTLLEEGVDDEERD